MTRTERLWCRVGMHRWTPWRVVNIPLIPMGDHDAITTTDGYEFQFETQSRTCMRCQDRQTKKVIHW